MGENKSHKESVSAMLDHLLDQAETSVQIQQRTQSRLEQLQQENAQLRYEKQKLHSQLTRLLEAIEHVPEVVDSRQAIPSMIRQVLTHDSADQKSDPPAPEAGKPAKRPSDREMLATWRQRYPQAFSDVQVQPLKVGIHADLVSREELPEQWVKRALASYVRLPKYLKTLRAGAVRLDLDGNNAGFVTEEEAAYAREQLQRLKEQREARERARNERAQQQRVEQKMAQLVSKSQQKA